MTDALVRDVANLLHSRGREVTHTEVADWLEVTVQRWNVRHPDKTINTDVLAKSVLNGSPWMTACLHLRFGDAL